MEEEEKTNLARSFFLPSFFLCCPEAQLNRQGEGWEEEVEEGEEVSALTDADSVQTIPRFSSIVPSFLSPFHAVICLHFFSTPFPGRWRTWMALSVRGSVGLTSNCCNVSYAYVYSFQTHMWETLCWRRCLCIDATIKHPSLGST